MALTSSIGALAFPKLSRNLMELAEEHNAYMFAGCEQQCSKIKEDLHKYDFGDIFGKSMTKAYAESGSVSLIVPVFEVRQATKERIKKKVARLIVKNK